MKEIILKELKQIEEKEKVKIILAVESGSRAWGFESKDSDYDVRFIYIREKEEYLALSPKRQVIEWKMDETLDINGWDLKKALMLLHNSNPTLVEWFASPIIYVNTAEADKIKKLVTEYFSVKKSMYHYYAMAKNNYKSYLLEDRVRAKKYFYVLRPVLAGKWIKEFKTIPPVRFDVLMDELLDVELIPVVKQLMEKKRQGLEMNDVPRIDELNEYLEKEMNDLKTAADLETKVNMPWEPLDEIFLKLLNE